MRKNIFLIILVAALFVFVGAMSNSAKAADDPVDLIKNAKTPVHLHSMAPGDALVHNLPSLMGTQWHSIYPPQTYCHDWVVIEDSMYTPPLGYSDELKIQHVETGNWVWIHVEDMTITLKLDHPDEPEDMYLEFGIEYSDVFPELIEEVLLDPVCTFWHEVRPNFCQWWHIHSWHEGSLEPMVLDSCDTIDIVPVEIYHVDSVHFGDPDTLYCSGEAGNIVLTGSYTPPGSPVCTYWHEEAPEYSNWWHIVYWKDNTSGELDTCDYIIIEPIEIWHVLDVYSDTVTIDSVDYAPIDPYKELTFTDAQIESCTYLHEESPDYCTWWHVIEAIDRNGGGIGHCDLIIVKKVEFWHVNDVATDILVQSIPDPTVPTLTQWGVIILAVLIVASAIFIMVRRKRATVPA